MRKIIYLLSAAMLAILMCGCAETRQDRLPQRVSLYLVQQGEIVIIDYKEYLTGCIFGCIEPSAGEEALKAVACAVNTYALYQLENGSEQMFTGADLCDDGEKSLPYTSAEEAKKLYGSSYPIYLEKVKAAAEYGLSHIITFTGDIFPAQMCRLSAGKTEQGADCSADKEHPEYLSTAAFSDDMVSQVLTELTGVRALPADRSGWFSSPEYSEGGTLLSMQFCGARVTGGQLKEAFSLRSTAISVEYTEERFVFTCRGWGENLGMSVNTAAFLAEKGHTAEEILRYFYRDTELTES